MEWILDRLNFRTFAAVGAVAALGMAANWYGGVPFQLYDRWRHPPTGPAVGGDDIAGAVEAHESAHLHTLYRRVSMDIATAQSQGLDVTGLQALADEALRFDKPRYRAAAIDRLNKIRMAIPQRSERVRAASLEEAADDEIPTPKSSSARSRSR